MSEPSRNLFVYGTLMVPEVVRRLLGHVLTMRPAQLKGYRRLRVEGAVYPGIIMGDPEDVVEGQVLSGMTASDWATLDRYEGDEYTRETITVVDPAGVEWDTDAYIFKDPKFLTSEAWDDRFVLDQLRDLGL